MKSIATGCLAMILLAVTSVCAGSLTDGDLSVALSSRGTYDSNPLKYSPRDRGRFFDQVELHSSPIRSLDDWRTDLKLSVGFSNKYFSIGESELKGIINFAHYAQNPIKNFGWLSLYANQQLSDRTKFSLNYFFEPQYYIRDYRDRHTGDYYSADFSLNQWTARLTIRPVKGVEFSGKGRIKSYYYNEYFTEYDGDVFQLGGDIILRERPWKLTIGWYYSQFVNTGYSELDRFPPIEDIEDNEAGQADYNENELNISIQQTLKVIGKRTYLRLGGSIIQRHYTTKLTIEEDPLHAGRSDITNVIRCSAKYFLQMDLSLEVGMNYSSRSSEAEVPLASILKTYYRWGSWIELSYSLQ